MEQLYDSKVDVSVLLIFFARPNQFIKVFEQVKLARPSRLFLYQDGAREGREDDVKGIEECRKIAESIDWECEVQKFYQKENVGCDPSEFIAQKWAFSFTDKCIILEDDDVPSQSFFLYCKELLNKYEFDERFNMICGMNHMGVSNYTPYSYLFTRWESISGWASWKRVIDTWDEHYSFLDDPFLIHQLKDYFNDRIEFKKFISRCKQHRKTGKAYYETILVASMILYNRINIVPAKNMICNIGICENSTHGTSNIKLLPKGIRRIFQMKVYEIEFPLKHPKYIVEDFIFYRKKNRIMAKKCPLVRAYRKGEIVLYKIIYKKLMSSKKQ